MLFFIIMQFRKYRTNIGISNWTETRGVWSSLTLKNDFKKVVSVFLLDVLYVKVLFQLYG